MQRKPPQIVSRLITDGQEAYREAVAAQIRRQDSTDAWDRWELDTAALLLISWAEGATATLKAAGAPVQTVTDVPISRFSRLDQTLRVGDYAQEIAMRFKSGPAREVVERYVRLIPMTRERWESLVSHAFQAAGEMRDDESANALERILERSPNLRAVVEGKPQPLKPGTPQEVQIRQTPAVQAAVQGSFFVTGMSQEQVEETRELLAKTVRGEITVSVAGKRLERLGVGDFVEQATLATGTDLTAARLETVYRTNLNRAQSQGRLDICRDETVKKFIPIMRFSATKDKRTRDTHKAMDGYIATTEQIDSMGIPTPLGFNCRCAWVPVSIAKALAQGFVNEDGEPNYEAIRRHNGNRQTLIDKGLVPDPNFIAG